jgi:hypothetical protein
MLEVRFWIDQLLQKAFIAVDYPQQTGNNTKITIGLIFGYNLADLNTKLFFPSTISRVEVLEGVDDFFDVLIR